MHWTKSEDKILKEEYLTKTIHNLCYLFPNRSYSAIGNRLIRLGLKAKVLSPIERFNALTRKISSCLIWQGRLNEFGYGNFRYKRKCVLAHRWIFEQLHGPIPKGKTVHHKCYNRACVNCDHLEVLSPRDNIMDAGSSNVGAINSRKTHCKRGHALFGDNLYIDPRGKRECKTCRRNNNYRLLKNGHH